MTLSHFAYHSLYKNLERILEELEFWILRSVPNLIEVISLNPVNSGDSNGIIYVSKPFWGTRTGTFRVFVYLLFLGNLLGESGRIIHRLKGLDEEIAAPLESKETVQ